MEVKKVVIADPNEEFRTGLAQSLVPDFQVECCMDGRIAAELIRRWEPDILVTELVLESMDGLDLIRNALQMPVPPKIMVITKYMSEFIHLSLEDLHIDYAMMKSCQVRKADERIRDIADTIGAGPKLPWRNMRLAAEILSELQIPKKLCGYAHLQVGLTMLSLQRDQRLTKELYEKICAVNNTNYTRLEKNIRDAIRAGWKKGDPSVWQKYFPDIEKVPNNGQFFFSVADTLTARTQQTAQ